MKKEELLKLVLKMHESETPEERECALKEFEKLKQYDALSSLKSIIAENQSGELEYNAVLMSAMSAMLILSMQGCDNAVKMIRRYLKSDNLLTMATALSVCHLWKKASSEVGHWVDSWILEGVK
jgi:hypothetical protein